MGQSKRCVILEDIDCIPSQHLLFLNPFSCLRNGHLDNDCQLCVSQCGIQAIDIVKRKIPLIKENCTNCGDCIGICPTESLGLKEFDVISFIFDFLEKDENRIIEKMDIPTLGIFNPYHLISLVLRTKRNLFLEYDQTNTEHNLNYLEKIVQQSNLFLASIGFESSLFIRAYKTESDINNKNSFSPYLTPEKYEQETTLPKKLVLFKNSLKIVCEDIATHLYDLSDLNTLFNKQINKLSCTNCIDCITFCPTNALFQSADKSSILFQSGKCIGCNICETVCKTQAIEQNNEIDLIQYMFDQTQQLVEFNHNEQFNSIFTSERDA